MKEETSEWVVKAEDDFRVASQLANSDQPSYDASCFHAQQCAEKYLKAFLVEHDIPFPKTHVLVDLLVLCRSLGSAFETLRQDAEDLTVYGVRVRYPGFDASENAAREALAAATRVRAFVRDRLGLGPPAASPPDRISAPPTSDK